MTKGIRMNLLRYVVYAIFLLGLSCSLTKENSDNIENINLTNLYLLKTIIYHLKWILELIRYTAMKLRIN